MSGFKGASPLDPTGGLSGPQAPRPSFSDGPAALTFISDFFFFLFSQSHPWYMHIFNGNIELSFLIIHCWCSLEAYFAHKSVIFQHTGQSHVIVEELEILKPQSIELLCNLTDNPSKPSNITGIWRKDGDEIENSQQTIYRQNDQYILKKMYV